MGQPARATGLEARIARLLRVGIYIAIALIAVGVGLMLAEGRSPLDGAPVIVLSQLPADLLHLRPAAFLLLGVIAVLVTPATRVVVAAVAYARARDRIMVLIALAVLAVIASGIGLGIQRG